MNRCTVIFTSCDTLFCYWADSFFAALNGTAIELYVCVCVFPHFSWRLACLVTMSVHLSRRPYLKCFKRLLSVLIVIMGWTTSSGTYTLRLAVDTHICSPTHPNLYVNHCTYMCACSLFLSLTHTNTHIRKSTYIWRSMRKTKYHKTCFLKNVCYLIMQHMTKMKKI